MQRLYRIGATSRVNVAPQECPSQTRNTSARITPVSPYAVILEIGGIHALISTASGPHPSPFPRSELPRRRATLSQRERLAAPAATSVPHQGATARALGHAARAQPDLRPPESPDSGHWFEHP